MDNEQLPYRVWWSTNRVMRYFYIEHVWQAKIVYATLVKREQDDLTVDMNAGGLEMFDKLTKEWVEFYDDDGQDISEFYEEDEKQTI